MANNTATYDKQKRYYELRKVEIMEKQRLYRAKKRMPVVIINPEPVEIINPEPVVIINPEPVVIINPEPVVIINPEPVVIITNPDHPLPTNEPSPPYHSTVDFTLLLQHNKHLKRVLRRFIPIAKDKTDTRSNYEAVMTEYTDKAVNYFKYKDIRTPLTVGERYITEAIDDEGIRTPLFFIITHKTKEGVDICICESWKELRDNRVIYQVDFAEQVEEATISNEELIHITQFEENLTYYSKNTFIPSNNIQLPTPLKAEAVKAEVSQVNITQAKEAEVSPVNITQAKPAINPEELLKRQTHINQLIPQLKIDTQLIQTNKSPPLYWKIIAKQDNKYELEQYKTHTGRDSLGKNYYTSFYEDSTNVKVVLPLNLLYNFDIHNPSKFYSDNQPNQRLKGFTTTNIVKSMPNSPPSLLQYLYC
jgi:hypothetical protein